MKFKVVPAPPESLEAVAEARRAVPLVPDGVDDCCARLLARTDIEARDDAREWLTFLRALGLVAEGERGFHRTRREFDRGELAAAFRERVYAADAVLDALEAADGSLDPTAAFERVRDRVPAWERRRRADWEREWTERVERLLGWAVLLGLAERDGEGYRPT